MGVPKFYRYLSERYPAISQLIADNRIPEFDCLYVGAFPIRMEDDCANRSGVAGHEWNHSQLYPQRWRLGHLPPERRQDVHSHIQLY